MLNSKIAQAVSLPILSSLIRFVQGFFRILQVKLTLLRVPPLENIQLLSSSTIKFFCFFIAFNMLLYLYEFPQKHKIFVFLSLIESIN
mgnify:CR=1 FL=1